MVLPTITIFFTIWYPHDSSFCSRNLKEVTPSEGVEWGWGRYELAIFDLQAALSPKRCKIRQKLLVTNDHCRIRIRAFDWYQNQRSWFTLKLPWTAFMHSVILHTCFSEPTIKIWMKIDPYYRRQKCILVSSKISFMRIFAGVRWRKVGWSKIAIFALLAHYIFQTVMYTAQCHNYYTVIYSRLESFQWHLK